MNPTAQLGFYRTLYSQSAASVTVGTTAAVLREHGIPTQLTLLEKGSHRNADKLLRDAPDQAVLLMKVNFQDAAESLSLADALASTHRYHSVFLFGVYAAGNASHLMRMLSYVHGVVTGEPEVVLPHLLTLIEKHADWRTAPPAGLIVRDENGTRDKGAGTPPVFDLATGPPPVRDIERSEVARIANLEATRGCLASCSFCHVPAADRLTGAPTRRVKPTAAVMAEVKELVGLGKRYLVFNDPVFWFGPRDTGRVQEIARELAALPEPVNFMVYLRTHPFPDESLLRELVSAGLVRVFLGVESNMLDVLKLYRKGTQKDAYVDVRRRLDQHGVSHHIGFLLFNPFSRLAEVEHDLRYLAEQKQLHRIGVVLEKARLTPGTALLAQAEAAGLHTGQRDPLTGDAAYSWNFLDPAAGAVHHALALTFRQDFEGRQKYLEYYHTSSQFLRCLVRRRVAQGGPDADAGWWHDIDELHGELSDLLSGYYTELVRQAGEISNASSRSAESSATDLPAFRDRGEFLISLKRLERSTEVAAALLFDRVARAGFDEQVESLFTSAEGTR